jgi:hypothetical protein
VLIVPSAQAAEKRGIKGDKGLRPLMLFRFEGRSDVEQDGDRFDRQLSDARCDIFEEE